MSLKSLIGYEEIDVEDICSACNGTGKQSCVNRYISGIHITVIAVFLIIISILGFALSQVLHYAK